MASPPFGINISVPADNDIVSQFPAVNRSDKDQLQSWIEVDHDTNGNHTVIHMPYQGSAPATPSSSIGAMYLDVNGNLVIKRSDGVIYYLGVPPGNVSFTAGATADNGWALANGGTQPRTGVGAALFSRIGTTYGSGDGSTTFNVPDIRGRYIISVDGGISRVTSTYFGTSPILGAVSTTLDHITLVTANLPPYTPSGSVSSTTSFAALQTDGPTIATPSSGVPPSLPRPWVSGTPTISSSFSGTPQGGTSTPFSTIGPAIVLQAQIKL